MIDQVKQEDCCGCSACALICPKGCIKMKQDKEGFYHPQLESSACINCKSCLAVCPVSQTQEEHLLSSADRATKAYAGYNTELLERYSSSSGGIFRLLANRVIEEGGVVFGAAFDPDFQVRHIGIEAEKDLEQLQGSKYVQSNLGDVFGQAKQYLEEGRQVLFSGTPCQVEGLFHFLKKPYQNLLTVDLFCTGVPSPQIWADYIEYRKKQAYAKKVEDINFRNKAGGWENYQISFSFDNGIAYSVNYKEDIYMQGFIRGLYLQPACYQCRFKGKRRNSDLTLGDFWGVQKELPDYYNPYGVSAILVHSQKGEETLKKLTQLKLTEVPIDSITKGNKNAMRSITAIEKRNLFSDAYQNQKLPLAEAVKKVMEQDMGQGKLRQYFNLLKQWVENLQNQQFLYETLLEQKIHKVGLIGLGDIGNRLIKELELAGDKIEISFVIDENKEDFEEQLEKVKNMPYDRVIICSFVNFSELREQLVRKGYQKERIVSLKDFV